MVRAPRVHQFAVAEAAITVVRRTRSLGRYHRRSQRMIGRASLAIRGAVFGLLRTLHHQSADALGIFFGRVSRDAKARLRVELREIGGQPQPALRNLANAAPLPMHRSEEQTSELQSLRHP